MELAQGVQDAVNINKIKFGACGYSFDHAYFKFNQTLLHNKDAQNQIENVETLVAECHSNDKSEDTERTKTSTILNFDKNIIR